MKERSPEHTPNGGATKSSEVKLYERPGAEDARTYNSARLDVGQTSAQGQRHATRSQRNRTTSEQEVVLAWVIRMGHSRGSA